MIHFNDESIFFVNQKILKVFIIKIYLKRNYKNLLKILQKIKKKKLE